MISGGTNNLASQRFSARNRTADLSRSRTSALSAVTSWSLAAFRIEQPHLIHSLGFLNITSAFLQYR